MQDDNTGGLSGSSAPQEQPRVDQPVQPDNPVSAQLDDSASVQPDGSVSVQLDNSVPVQPTQSTQSVQPEQPANTVESTNTPNVLSDNASESKKSKKVLAIVLSIVVAAVVIAGIVAAVILMGGGNGGVPSASDVERYCRNNGYETEVKPYNEDGLSGDMVMCEKSGTEYSAIQYVILDEDTFGSDEINKLQSALNSLGGDFLIDSDNYKKMYYGFFGTTSYFILRGNSIITVSTMSNDVAKKILIDLGYPDDKWSEVSSSNWDYDWRYDESDNDEDEDGGEGRNYVIDGDYNWDEDVVIQCTIC